MYSYVPAMGSIGYTNDDLLAKIVAEPWPIVNDLYEV